MKNKVAKIIITIGVILVAAGIGLLLYNLISDRSAGARSAAVLTEMEDVIAENQTWEDSSETVIPDYILDPEVAMPTIVIDGVEYIGKITIPAVNMELPVISEWSYENLDTAPCRYDGSVYTDDLVLAAHNYTTHFGPIGRLVIGDEVIFTDVEGNEFRYEVAELETLEDTAVEEMTSGDWDLTLFTCTLSRVTRTTVRCNRIDQGN